MNNTFTLSTTQSTLSLPLCLLNLRPYIPDLKLEKGLVPALLKNLLNSTFLPNFLPLLASILLYILAEHFVHSQFNYILQSLFFKLSPWNVRVCRYFTACFNMHLLFYAQNIQWTVASLLSMYIHVQVYTYLAQRTSHQTMYVPLLPSSPF